MSYVYVLEYSEPYYEPYVVAVFTTLELATDYLEELEKQDQYKLYTVAVNPVE